MWDPQGRRNQTLKFTHTTVKSVNVDYYINPVLHMIMKILMPLWKFRTNTRAEHEVREKESATLRQALTTITKLKSFSARVRPKGDAEDSSNYSDTLK